MADGDDGRPRRVARPSADIVRHETIPSITPTSMKRDTRQRRAIRSVFMNVGRALTAGEVLQHGQQMMPSLGLATVYRNVKILAGEGWLSEVELPGGGTRYELAERPHHHHFLCRACDLAFNVERCPERVEELAPEGFVVDGHELILYGRCAACR